MLPFLLVACSEQAHSELTTSHGGSQIPPAEGAPTQPPVARLVPVGGSVLSILADLRVTSDWYDDEFQRPLRDRLEKRVTRDGQALRVSVQARAPTGIKLEFELRPTDIGPPTIEVAAYAYTDVPHGPGVRKADITWGVVYVTTSNVLRTPVIKMKFHLLLDSGGKRIPVSGGLILE